MIESSKIVGYEGLYSIISNGDVYSHKSNKLLSPGVVPGGYYQIHLYNDGRKRSLMSHILVAEHFLPNPGRHEVVMHLDDDPSNNDVSNLKWGTQKENIQDCILKGRNSRGEGRPAAKLTESDVRLIRSSDLSGYALAKIFNVSATVIRRITKGEAWKHVL